MISTDPYAHADQGFAGPTPLYIYIDGQGKVCQIVAADNADTPHFFNNAFSHITPQYVGKTAEEATQVKVDAVTGATFSSRAIIANVQKSLASYSSASASADKAPAIGWGKGIAVVIVLLLGAGISLLFRGNRPLRVVQLVLNVLVLGFWCGQFLSLSLLRGWIANGIDVGATWPTLLVLIVAIAMPLIKNKHYYCTWICPYGSLQELTSRLPFPKIHCSAAVYRWMSRVRMMVFCLLMLLLWAAFWGGEVLDYEPFTAFLFTTAMPAVIILAAAFVLASCFVPRLWCRSLCPMGQLLDFAEDSTSRKAPILKNKCKTLIQKNK
uniref:4Fe-4S binding protein n=1 Tax=Alloprevotella sp. TaxID=1872471 RepID=UPI004027FD6C